MRRFLAAHRLTEAALTGTVFVGGLAAVAGALAMIYPPAGLLFAGVAASGCAVLYVRGSR